MRTHGEQVKGRESQVAIAKLNLGYATLASPADGYVTKKAVEVGNQIQAGQPLMAVVSLSDLSIIANYKETQLHAIRPGQRSASGSTRSPTGSSPGRVESVMAGTGAAFSLFPPRTRAATTSRSCSASRSRSSSTRTRGRRRSCASACPSSRRSLRGLTGAGAPGAGRLLEESVRVCEATGASLRSCVCAAGPHRARGSQSRNSPAGSNNEPSSLRDRPGHGSGLIGGSAHLPSGTPQPPRDAWFVRNGEAAHEGPGARRPTKGRLRRSGGRRREPRGGQRSRWTLFSGRNGRSPR